MSSTPQRRRHANTSTAYNRIQPQPNAPHGDAVHYAINQLKKRQSCRHQRCQRRDDQAFHQKSGTSLCTKVQQGHQTKRRTTTQLAGDTTIKVTCKSEDPSSPPNCRPNWSPCCTNSPTNSSANVYKPHKTPVSLLTKQASGQVTSRQTTCAHSSNSDGEPPSGTSHFALQPLASQRQSTQVKHSSVWQALREQGIEEPDVHMLKKHYATNEQHCTPTSKGNNSASSGGPNRLTRSARSCSTYSRNTS